MCYGNGQNRCAIIVRSMRESEGQYPPDDLTSSCTASPLIWCGSDHGTSTPLPKHPRLWKCLRDRMPVAVGSSTAGTNLRSRVGSPAAERRLVQFGSIARNTICDLLLEMRMHDWGLNSLRYIYIYIIYI